MSVQRRELYPKNVFTYTSLLSTSECSSLIEKCEKQGFEPATLSRATSVDGKIQEEVRNHDRVIIEDNVLAANLWKNLSAHFPPELTTYEDGTKALGLSPKFRVYRYNVGQLFARHYDGYNYGSNVYSDINTQKNAAKPRLSLLVYLNEDFEGGRTLFFSPKGKEILNITPESGSGLVFTYTMLHEGSVVTKGVKYVLRTDILYGDNTQQSSWVFPSTNMCSVQ